MNISKEIGLPALLEQCAEECMELGHACLKLARIMRDDNPTPADKEEVIKNICEESADVNLCINSLMDAELFTLSELFDVEDVKEVRWKQRILEAKNNKNNPNMTQK